MEQIVGLTATIRAKGISGPVENVGHIAERTQNLGYARDVSQIELDHEYRPAALDRSPHTTQHLDLDPFHVAFYELRREPQSRTLPRRFLRNPARDPIRQWE